MAGSERFRAGSAWSCPHWLGSDWFSSGSARERLPVRVKSDSVEAPTVGADGYCLVTVVSGARRLDVALPSGIPCGDLLPGLLRLVHSRGDETPDGSNAWRRNKWQRNVWQRNGWKRNVWRAGPAAATVRLVADPGRPPAARHGRDPSQAGVLHGDVLSLVQAAAEDRDSRGTDHLRPRSGRGGRRTVRPVVGPLPCPAGSPCGFRGDCRRAADPDDQHANGFAGVWIGGDRRRDHRGDHRDRYAVDLRRAVRQ